MTLPAGNAAAVATPDAIDVVRVTRSAMITGIVEYREGDGAKITIRRGPCEVHETALDATISWTDGEWHGSAAMPIADFRRYTASRAIELVAAQARPVRD